MNLASPLSSLIPSMDAAALEVLAGTEVALGVTKIHRLATHGSRQGIANALDRLVAHGLVQAEPANTGFMYRLNRDHLLTPAVLQAHGARHELFRRIATQCSEMTPRPLSVTLFGSLARGDSTSDSDIDLLIVHGEQLDDLEQWSDQLHELSVKVESWTGNQLQVITRDVNELISLSDANEPIVDAWCEDGITIAGVDIHTLLNPRSGLTEKK